jgi:hypothetical protein
MKTMKNLMNALMFALFVAGCVDTATPLNNVVSDEVTVPVSNDVMLTDGTGVIDGDGIRLTSAPVVSIPVTLPPNYCLAGVELDVITSLPHQGMVYEIGIESPTAAPVRFTSTSTPFVATTTLIHYNARIIHNVLGLWRYYAVIDAGIGAHLNNVALIGTPCE